MTNTSIDIEFIRFFDKINSENIQKYKNLSAIKELIANYKGFNNWYDLEKYFSTQDKHFSTYNDNNYDLRFLINNIERIIYVKNEIKTYQRPLKSFSIKAQKPISNIIGYDKLKKIFKPQHYYSVNNYPFYIEGCTGSGSTEVALTLAYQNIENNEGVIFLDHNGDNVLYSKIYSCCEENNRLEDLYVFNMMSPLEHSIYSEDYEEGSHLLKKNIKSRSYTHTIEPFNFLIDHQQNFEEIFGINTTKWLYPYLLQKRNNNINICLDSLIDLFSFHTLLSMKNNDYGNQQEVTEYLNFLGLDELTKSEDELIAIMMKHFKHNEKALDIINFITIQSYLFSDNPDIDLEQIFLERKILVTLYPVLEKSSDEVNKICLFINNLIYVAEKSTRKYNMHFQNIYSINAAYGLFYVNNSNELKETKNKYTFVSHDFYGIERHVKAFFPPSKHNFYNINFFQSFLLLKGSPTNLSKNIYYMYSNIPTYQEYINDIKSQSEGIGHFVDTVNMCSTPIDYSNTTDNKHFVYYKNSILEKIKPYKGVINTIPIRCLYYSPKKIKHLQIINHKGGK